MRGAPETEGNGTGKAGGLMWHWGKQESEPVGAGMALVPVSWEAVARAETCDAFLWKPIEERCIDGRRLLAVGNRHQIGSGNRGLT